MFGLGVCATAILTLMLPASAPNLDSLLLLRALMGLCEACTFPAANVLFSEWFPAKERSFLLTLVYSGSYLGQAIAYPLSVYFINLRHNKDNVSVSWPLVFYFFGALGIAWFLCWRLLIYSTPDLDPTISSEERAYIKCTSKQDADVVLQKVAVTRSPHPPWRGFFTCPAAWALYLNHFAYG